MKSNINKINLKVKIVNQHNKMILALNLLYPKKNLLEIIKIILSMILNKINKITINIIIMYLLNIFQEN